MPPIHIHCEPPSHGWLTLQLRVGDRCIEIDASDVPNNPVQDLADALDLAARGLRGQVWWNLEPDGYFMSFEPVGDALRFQLDFAPCSERRSATTVLAFQGARSETLLPFWRFLRAFQSRAYAASDWPAVNYERLPAIKTNLDAGKLEQ